MLVVVDAAVVVDDSHADRAEHLFGTGEIEGVVVGELLLYEVVGPLEERPLPVPARVSVAPSDAGDAANRLAAGSGSRGARDLLDASVGTAVVGKGRSLWRMLLPDVALAHRIGPLAPLGSLGLGQVEPV